MLKWIKDRVDKYQRTKRKCAKLKKKYIRDCQHIYNNIVELNKNRIHTELEEEKRKAHIIREYEIQNAHKYSEAVKHDAVVTAQNILTKAAKMGDVMTIELYNKDIYGRPFFRLAPKLDPEGYAALKDGTGPMKFTLIFPDGSKHNVEAIPYQGK